VPISGFSHPLIEVFHPSDQPLCLQNGGIGFDLGSSRNAK
jgi:hypothetical protein